MAMNDNKLITIMRPSDKSSAGFHGWKLTRGETKRSVKDESLKQGMCFMKEKGREAKGWHEIFNCLLHLMCPCNGW